MAESDNTRSSRIDPGSNTASTTGFNTDRGPYIGEVVSHVASTRMGQLEVWLPDKGPKGDPNAQKVCSYCSPFYGTTFGTGAQDFPPDAWTSGQSYGMWMVPPDVGSRVLVIFAGTALTPFWIGCLYESSNHHMVPGMARNIGGSANTEIDPTTSNGLANKTSKDSLLPVTEYSTGEPTAFNPDGLTNTHRYAHNIQSSILVNQGLDSDPVRGAISSSSMREVPSNVYGISTPGKKIGASPNVPGDDPTNEVFARFGGHQFVMDDGDANGVDQLIRLRTAGGHQILMNDTAEGNGVLYIASKSGYHWMEFSSDGSINLYAEGGVNINAGKGALNLNSESSVNISSGGSVKINGEMGVKISSLVSVDITSEALLTVKTGGALSLSAFGVATLSAGGAVNLSAVGPAKISGATILLNSPYLPVPPIPPVPTMPNSLLGTDNPTGQWVAIPGITKSTCSVVPTHEPWIDPGTGNRPSPVSSSGLGGLATGAALSIGAKLI
jgi:hypothetical protein